MTVRGAWGSWWPMAALCLLGSTVWMAEQQWPAAGSTPGSWTAGCLAGAALLAGLGWKQRSRDWVWAAVGGAMVVVGPVLGMVVGATVDAGSLALVMTLVAVVVAVADGVGELTGDRLWPGMAGAVGMLLVLPVPSIADWRNDVVMVLAPVMTGVGCVVFRRSAGGGAWKGAVGLVVAAVVFGVGWVVMRGGISVAAMGIDGLLAGLGLVALSRVEADQYAARFLVVPLVVLVEGVVLLHSVVTWRAVACGVLLAAGSVALLRAGAGAGTSEEERIS